MTTLSKKWLPSAFGIGAVIAGLALLVAVAASGDAIGRSVTVLIGAGFAFGVLACVVKETVARRGSAHYAAPRAGSAASHVSTSATIVAMPPAADATASEFDETEGPAFAPVVSLTEAQVERQRAERLRKERRATLTRA